MWWSAGEIQTIPALGRIARPASSASGPRNRCRRNRNPMIGRFELIGLAGGNSTLDTTLDAVHHRLEILWWRSQRQTVLIHSCPPMSSLVWLLAVNDLNDVANSPIGIWLLVSYFVGLPFSIMPTRHVISLSRITVG